MKKNLALALALILVLGIFAGCSSTTATYKTGIGSTISIARSADATATAAGTAQVNTIMAAVTVDAKGKIVKVSIDASEIGVKFDNTGKITSDKTAAQKSVKELGDAFGMKKASPIKAEWYQQVADLENWMTGKTIEEVKAMKTTDKAGKKVPAEADLTSKVTIGVSEFIEAVEKAVANAK